jgi:hypothetical protein
LFVTGRDVAEPVRLAEEYIAGLDGSQRLDIDTEATDFRYRLASTLHEDRAIVLHVLFFHVRLDEPG